MLELLAFTPEDGWAFVREDGPISLIRPPYRRWCKSSVDESTLETAVASHGFIANGRSFAAWEALISFLEEELVNARRALGGREPDSHSFARLARHAGREVLQEYLDRVESELLESGELKAALTILNTLLGLDTIKTDPALLEHAGGLLQHCAEQLANIGVAKATFINHELDVACQFPQAASAYGADAISNQARQIKDRKQLLPVGAN